jgi:rubrerythrin
MTITIAVVAAIALYLTNRQAGRRERDLNDHLIRQEQRHSAHMAKVLAQKNPDLEQLIGLIDRQMQRIQAPAQAVVDHSVAQMPESLPAVGFDDDDAFWKSRELDKEQLAEAEMHAERVTSGVA